ncbi:heme peroxidase [Mycolicibacterium nivoides]|uniref:heme peroxidase n=1 Tax=Mycolicibacterium nivoides TaxID=2487344 RepID=UPI0008B60D01|nr:heme peroxidase [Mycolicibacterium nivoides]SEQ38218.1 hypothetical protein SAMN04488583_2522 [Mycobacterium sp. 88mf]SFF47049.1 hypothetical protein SAMN04488582_102858 [Mycobacterium sp. 455mf]
MSTEVERLHAACERDLGDPAGWPDPTAYPNALALCIIDAIYVTGARHLTVERIVERYRGHRAGQGGDADSDGAGELLASIHGLGGPRQWASQIGNRRPTSTAKGAPLRSAALLAAAHALVELGIRTAEDLRTAAQDDDRRAAAKAAWCAVPGQQSGFTWGYLVTLAQVPGVTVDRAVAGYVAREAGTAAPAAALLRAVSESAGWEIAALHHAIWRFESGRPYQREVPA